MSSRTSGASVGICYPCTGAGHDAKKADPDTRSLRSLLRDDSPVKSLRSLPRDDSPVKSLRSLLRDDRAAHDPRYVEYPNGLSSSGT